MRSPAAATLLAGGITRHHEAQRHAYRSGCCGDRTPNDKTLLYSLADYHMVLTGSTQESTSKLSPFFRFSVLSAISLLIWWSPLTASLALALRDSRYTHILMILPVSVTLIYLEWKSFESSTESRSDLGLILLVAAVAATVVARLHIFPLLRDEQLSVNMLAVVVWWIGAFVVSFGTRAFRRALFPLCFLFWMVPIPEFVLNPIVRLLQEGSVASARLLFAIAGVPVAQDGTQLTIPGLTVEVAPECSSIRSSLMLVVTTMVLAQMSLRSVWRKALVIAVAIPLSVAKNGLRIFVLAMLTTRVDRSFLAGRLHHQGGIIYFLIALAAIILLIWAARRGEEKPRALAMTDR
ncbi:MAG: exosortase/archaeosortase family protein [Candidatus Sulfotelmatobacter sp.]